eukprot:scaffold81755_cov55-Phaeocystis_antarctica.AAC.6
MQGCRVQGAGCRVQGARLKGCRLLLPLRLALMRRPALFRPPPLPARRRCSVALLAVVLHGRPSSPSPACARGLAHVDHEHAFGALGQRARRGGILGGLHVLEEAGIHHVGAHHVGAHA